MAKVNQKRTLAGRLYPFAIRNTLVPQAGQVPCVAFLPFLNVTGLGLRISRFALHLRQYASISTSGFRMGTY